MSTLLQLQSFLNNSTGQNSSSLFAEPPAVVETGPLPQRALDLEQLLTADFLSEDSLKIYQAAGRAIGIVNYAAVIFNAANADLAARSAALVEFRALVIADLMSSRRIEFNNAREYINEGVTELRKGEIESGEVTLEDLAIEIEDYFSDREMAQALARRTARDDVFAALLAQTVDGREARTRDVPRFVCVSGNGETKFWKNLTACLSDAKSKEVASIIIDMAGSGKPRWIFPKAIY